MTALVISMVALAFVPCLHARNGVSSSTGALLTFPFGGGLSNMTVTPAEFGIHVYGGNVRGLLVIAAEPKYRRQCPTAYHPPRNNSQEPDGLNPYLLQINNYSLQQERWIMLIDRGDCFFVDKVRHAESLGADAVIVVDNRVEGLVIMWPPESFQQNTVNIPSVFLSEMDGAKIYKALKVNGFDPFDMAKSNLSYPDPAVYPRLTASIEWGLPHPDDVVEWELWTSSDDKLSVDFFPFGEISDNLTRANDAVFTPHYVILDGSHWGCVAPHNPCGKQCTNGGRYCTEDPDKDLLKGITGGAVVQENLRQMCVFKYGNDVIQDYLLWWQYVRAFHARCYDVPNYETTFNEHCSFQQMDQLVPSKDLSQYVASCIALSGGYGWDSGENSLLKNETSIREKSGVYISPTISINGFHIYGRLSCPLPIKKNTCQAFEAICAGFLEGTEPSICLANEVSCLGRIDCNGVCDGGFLMDACRVCLLPNSTEYNACLDCERVPFGGRKRDCNGVCGGVAVENRCSICVNRTMPNWYDHGADCSGQCGGPNKMDRCQACLNPLRPEFDGCVGCDNRPHSNKSRDCQNQCGGPHVYLHCPHSVTLCVDTRNKDYKNACSGLGGSQTDNGKAASSSIILIVLSVAALLLVLVVLGIMYKNRRDTDARFSSLINQYQPLENEPQHGHTATGQIQAARIHQEDAA